LERTLISWNIPNLITIPLMAFAGFLLLAVIWQFVGRMAPDGGFFGIGGDAA
jgi:hypothetical protein